jgi:hypothetical protein
VVGPISGPVWLYTTLAAAPPSSGTPVNPVPATGGHGSGATFDIIQGWTVSGGAGVRVISVEWADAQLSGFGSTFLTYILTSYFHPQIIETVNSEEVVAGQYWRNTKTKTRVLMPGSTVFTTPAGGV